jgi:hypothetical protein
MEIYVARILHTGKLIQNIKRIIPIQLKTLYFSLYLRVYFDNTFSSLF